MAKSINTVYDPCESPKCVDDFSVVITSYPPSVSLGDRLPTQWQYTTSLVSTKTEVEWYWSHIPAQIRRLTIRTSS